MGLMTGEVMTGFIHYNKNRLYDFIVSTAVNRNIYIYLFGKYFEKYIQDVTGGTDQTSGECSLGQTIPI